jgi:hypothetical protein
MGGILGSEAMDLVFRDRLFERAEMLHFVHLQHDIRGVVWR